MTVVSLKKKEVQRRHFLDLLNSVATAACRSGNPSSSLDTVHVLGLLYFAEFCTLRNSKRNSFSCILRNINVIICNLRNKLPCKIRNLCMENCKMRKFRKIQIDMQKFRILQILRGFDSAKYRILS